MILVLYLDILMNAKCHQFAINVLYKSRDCVCLQGALASHIGKTFKMSLEEERFALQNGI